MLNDFIGCEVQVYFNLNKKLWSIKAKVNNKWRVVGYTYYLSITPIKARVGAAGFKQVNREKQKNVHAWLHGVLQSIDIEHETNTLDEISYNPYFMPWFYTTKDKLELNIDSYESIYFDYNTKKCYGVLNTNNF